MSEERRKVLEMLADKKITAEEAEKLLDKLSAQPSAEAKPEESTASKPRYLRIVVEKPNQDHVNVRIPLSFARSGSQLLAVLPTKVRERLAEQGIDLSETGALNPEKWADLIAEMPIDIEKGSGKKVRIFCE